MFILYSSSLYVVHATHRASFTPLTSTHSISYHIISRYCSLPVEFLLFTAFSSSDQPTTCHTIIIVHFHSITFCHLHLLTKPPSFSSVSTNNIQPCSVPLSAIRTDSLFRNIPSHRHHWSRYSTSLQHSKKKRRVQLLAFPMSALRAFVQCCNSSHIIP